MANYVKKVSTGGSSYYIKDVEARTVPILASEPTESTGTWMDSDSVEHDFYIGSRCRVRIEADGIETYKFYLLCNITSDGKYIWGESSGSADAPQVTYGPVSVSLVVPKVPASGGTVTCPVPTYSQRLTITFNGQTFNGNITEGATIYYGTSPDPTETDPSNVTITGTNLSTSETAESELGTFYVRVVLNGKTGTASAPVKQEANAISGVIEPALSCANFAVVEPLAAQTASQTVTGTCKLQYTSGATASGTVNGTVSVTSVSSNNTGNFTASYSGNTVTVVSAGTNTSTSSTKTATITINGKVTYGGFTTVASSTTATATQKADYDTKKDTYGTPVLSGSFAYAEFSDLGQTLTPSSVPTYSQSVTINYKSGNTKAGTPITSGGTFTYSMTAATGFTLNDASTGSITVAENTSASRSTTVSVTVTLNGKTSAATTCTITQAKGTPYKAVDLGLPSGTLWCSTNVGASTETEYGEYFSWGDTIGHHKNGVSDGYSFSQDNYNAGKCGSGHTLSGDIPQGNATYDAATANMGYPWKMFTKAQGQELIDNTTSQWTTINGVNGRKFINKSDSSKYIFLPAGGGWNDTTHYSVGSNGDYWSTLWGSSADAWNVRFYSSGIYWDNYYRRLGISVVGVR